MNKESVSVSIIVLTYRVFDNIGNNLKSILNQTFKNYEIIIHDDGSENFDFDYLNSMLSETGVYYTIKSNDSNVGTVRNYNRAVDLAKGDIIIPLSQDDVFYDNNSLQKIVDFFNEFGCDVCQGKRIGSDSGLIFPDEYDCDFFNRSNKDCFLHLLYSNYVSGSTLYFKRDFFYKVGMFDEHFCLLEDRPFVTKIVLLGYQINLLNCITIIYGEDGVSSQKPSKKILKDYISLYSLLIEKIVELDLPAYAMLFTLKQQRHCCELYYKGKTPLLDTIRNKMYKLFLSIKGLGIKEYEVEKLINSCKKEENNV